MGLLTNLLNPKIAIVYLSLLPQFIDPANGSVLSQALVLGTTQIVISLVVNAIFIVSASAIAQFFTHRPSFAAVQRWVTGTVFAGLALRMATESQR